MGLSGSSRASCEVSSSGMSLPTRPAEVVGLPRPQPMAARASACPRVKGGLHSLGGDSHHPDARARGMTASTTARSWLASSTGIRNDRSIFTHSDGVAAQPGSARRSRCRSRPRRSRRQRPDGLQRHDGGVGRRPVSSRRPPASASLRQAGRGEGVVDLVLVTYLTVRLHGVPVAILVTVRTDQHHPAMHRALAAIART